MKKILITLAVILTVVGVYFTTKQPEVEKPLTKMDFLIDWQNDPTYIGVYNAKSLGLFKEIGLDMEIIQSWGATTAVSSIASGKYSIGTNSGGSTVLGRNTDANVVSTAVIYDRIPTTVYSLSEKNIKTPKDLEGKRIGMYPGSTTVNEFDAFAKINNVDKSKIEVVTLTGADIPLLLADQVDAVVHYTEASPVIVRESGRSVNELILADYGVGGYGLNVITSESFQKENPKLVKNITKAVVNGYKEACKDRSQTVDRFLAEFPEKDKGYYVNSLNIICEKLINQSGIGNQTEKGWQDTIDMYKGLGLLTKDIKASDILVK